MAGRSNLKTIIKSLLIILVTGYLILEISRLLLQENYKQLTNYRKTETERMVKEGYNCYQRIALEWKTCLLSLANKSPNRASWIVDAVNRCFQNYTKQLPPLIPLENRGEIKYILMPAKNDSRRRACNVITLGIGNDIVAEELLKNLQPYCKFYGADPMYDVGVVYKTVGHYYHVAVGASGGNYTASVYVNDTYKDFQVRHVSFEDFLLKMVNVTFIDYLIMDVEGAEYGLLPLLETTRKQKMSLEICQINTELHISRYYNYHTTEEQINKVMISFLVNSSYVPVVAVDAVHYRLMFIDLLSPKCIRKYLPNFCSD